ncbi:helix-turn-helix domain-containing protein [Streptomyces siamensis]|uniref:HTH luxR-type domain-containing protein n=1 Tax=Streptomyces siamensis TaxID=1274986 RepID=A0ABP9JEJ9_9ACTN
MYEALGLTDRQADLYEYLVQGQVRHRPQISRELDLEDTVVQDLLNALQELGLVVKDPDDPAAFSVIAPDLSLEALIRRKEGELQRMRLHSALLADRYRLTAHGRQARDIVEVVRGPSEVDARVRLIERQVIGQIEVLSAPPYSGGFTPSEDELGLLARGVRSRVIYSSKALNQDHAVQTLEQFRKAGDEARILPEVPMKMLIADRRIALIPLSSGQDAAAIVVRPCGLLDALCSLFASLWEKAKPYTGADQLPRAAGLTEDDRQLLHLLTSGLKDEAAARHLGLSLRTVRRRVAALMDRTEANTRFQAGYLLGLGSTTAPGRTPSRPAD